MNAAIDECELPPGTMLDPELIRAAYFRDSWRTSIRRPDLGMVDIFFALFGHHPVWMKMMLILRHGLVSLLGLTVPKASEVVKVERKRQYNIGDTIGVWPIF